MTKEHGNHFFFCRAFWNLLSKKCCLYLSKEPWISFCSSGNHNSVTTCIFPHSDSIFSGKNITISDNRNRNSFFNFFDNIPVCLSGIILDSRPPVNSNGSSTIFLHDLCKFRSIDMVIIKTFSKLYCNW